MVNLSKVILITICFSICNVIPLFAFNQYYKVDIIGNETLNGSPVFNVISDSQGFVWISSRSKIGRSDGRNIKYYTLGDNDGRQISLRKDKKNNIWAFIDTGHVYLYDSLSDSFRLYYSLVSDGNYLLLNDIFIDYNEDLWMATSNGLTKHNFHDISTNKVEMLKEGTFISVLYPISDSILAVGTNDGLLFLDKEKQVLLSDFNYKGEHITALYKDSLTNKLWIGTFSSGLFLWDENLRKDITPEYIAMSIPKVPIKVIRPFGANNFLLGLDGKGVYNIDTLKKTSEQLFTTTDQVADLIEDNGVYDILIDKNNIWIATYSNGVSTIRYTDLYKWVRHIPNNNQSLDNNYVHAIYEDSDGDFWYATKSGISNYSLKKQRWKNYLEGENAFLTITEDNDKNIWCGGFSTGIYCINKMNGKIRHIRSLKNTNQADCIYASYKDDYGDLWFGGLYNPLTRISRNKNGEEIYYYFNIEQVNSISRISNELLFIATTNGFYIFNRVTQKYEHFFTDPNQYNISSSSFVYSGVVVDNNIWFGTDGGGLNCFNIETHEVKNYSTYNSALPSNYIYAIVRDKTDKLWISTNNGIFSFDTKSKSFVLNLEDLPTKQFIFNSSTQNHQGQIIFGSKDGVLSFFPEEIKTRSQKYPLCLTDFRLFYKKIRAKDNPEILSTDINNISSLTLQHNQNTFSFDYIYLDLYDPSKYVYEYMLEEFDKDWIIKGSSLTADYMNVPPGKYIFKLRCLDNTFGNVLAQRQIYIYISQPIWNTIWAWLIYFIILIIFICWIRKFYKNKLEKKRSEEKINFFVNIAHDLRTPLSLVVAPLQSLGNDKNLSQTSRSYLKLAEQNCAKLTSVVTQLLDFQKIESASASLNLSSCNFKTDLKEHIDKFRILALMKNIKIHLELPVDEMLIELDSIKMDSIINNLLSNAIKYTNNGGDVFVTLSKTANKIKLEIKDTGIGISKNEQNKIFNYFYRANNAINSKEVGSGIGLVYAKKLVELMSGELFFTSKENEGTTFSLVLPTLEVDYTDELRETKLSMDKDTPIIYPESNNFKLRLDTYKILLIEDNDDLREYLAHILSKDYNIQSVGNAEEALIYLKSNSVDLVISDVMMSGMNGFELCKTLKESIEISHIQIILLTALSDRNNIVEGLEYGADDYITKPFDVEILKAKIYNSKMSRKKLQQHYLTLTNFQNTKSEKDDRVSEEAKENQIDKDFLNTAIQIVVKNMSNSEFTINDLCRMLAMSRTLFYEKLKILTNQSPNEFIRSIRLKRAKEILLEHKYSIQEVAEMTGFSDSKYFSTVFKKYFGESPSRL